MKHTIVIYSENNIGLLVQFSNVFTRRSLSIWSLYAVPSTIKGIHTITIVTDGSEEKVRQAIKHLEKLVDVVKVFCDKGNSLAGWAGSPSVTPERDAEVLTFLKERENNK